MLRLTSLFLFSIALASADVQNGVVRSAGQPIPGATVTALCGSDKITTVTDGDGRFEMGGLPSTPCRFSAAMFGFEVAQSNVTASSTLLTLDLRLQAKATLPPADEPVEVVKAAPPATGAEAKPAAATPAAAPDAPKPSLAAAQAAQTPQRGGGGRGGNGAGRGGQQTAANAGGRGGREGQGTQGPTGFQSLSLNGAAAGPEGDAVPGAGFDTGGGAAAAGDTFQINGSISSDVTARPGDGLGMGGPDGFGGGRGGFNPNSFGDQPGGENPFAGGGDGGGRGGRGGGGPGGFGGGPGGGGRGGGGFGGPGGGRGGGRGPGGPPSANGRGQFGNRVNRGRGQQWRLTANYSLGNSALNARPYSFQAPTYINGQPLPKAAYAANRFGFSVGGPLEIPHLFKTDKVFWFVNYTGSRTKNGFDKIGTVPTAAIRTGDFSSLSQAIYNPATNAPFAGNVIPQSLISPIAASLLQYFPLPNASGTRNNYQLIGADASNNDNIQVMVNETLTPKDRLNTNISYQTRNSSTTQTFGFRDPGTGSGFSASIGYSRTINRNLINSLNLSFSRNIANQNGYFSYGKDIEGSLGINGVFNTPLTYGPPTLSFTNFSSLTDGSPSVTRSQTLGLTESLIQVHGKHTITYGAQVQERQNNPVTTSGARGTFSFTGVETQQVVNGLPVSGTGYDFADYLLSLPYNTSVNRYLNGNNAFYYRETTGNIYVSDDFRWKTNFSIISGLRWEYFGPYTEKNDRMANLDIAPGYTGVAVVTPGQIGGFTNIRYPSGLIKPDYKLFSPREGIAWKPFKKGKPIMTNLVIRAGYGIYYTGGVYGGFTSRLGIEQPFVYSINETNTSANPLTLANGFGAPAGQTIQNTFSVDPNYKPAYAQSWNYSMQDTVWRNYVIQLGYQGTKGTHLDVVQSPNRAPLGSAKNTQTSLQIPYAGTFEEDLSVGNSGYNALQFSFLRRQARNRSFNLSYVFAKAIDDTSTLGGGVVQQVNDIKAERGLSNYDVRHRFTGNYQIQSPVPNTRNGLGWAALRGWQLNGSLTATSGSTFTATVSGDPSGTGIPGQARAQATGLAVTNGVGYFNPAAFAVPATGTYGNAGRNTIPGIPSFTMNMSINRTFRYKERHQLTFSVTSNNPLNRVNVTGIGTVIGSSTEGLANAAGGMRNITMQTRLTF